MYRMAQGASHVLAVAGQDLGGKKGALMNAFGTIGAAVAGQFADREERSQGFQTLGKQSLVSPSMQRDFDNPVKLPNQMNSQGFGTFDQTSTSSALPKEAPSRFAKSPPSAVTKQSMQGFNDPDIAKLIRQDQILSRKLGF